MAARHRIAVLGGGEINVVGSDCICSEVYDIVPVGANLFIFSFLLAVCGHIVSNDLPGVDVYIRTLRIAAGAKLDGRAALHLRRVAGQVLAIDLQIQGLERDGQALNGDIVKCRFLAFTCGVPLVSAVLVSDLKANAVRLLQEILPHRGIGYLQCADDGGSARTGEICASVGDNCLDAARVLGVAEGSGVVRSFSNRFDIHCSVNGIPVQVDPRVLCAVDGVIAGHVGQQREG